MFLIPFLKMIANPYICIDPKTTSHKLGEICYANTEDQCLELGYCAQWRPYADFEREKLRVLGCEKSGRGLLLGSAGYEITTYSPGYVRENNYTSDILIGYSPSDYATDSESSRLLKRAEFLKAVCEKEGVTFLPKAEECVPPDSERPTLRKLLEGTPLKRETPLAAHPPITQVGYEAAVEKAEEAKRRLDEDELRCCDYYAKKEIDDRISALINHSDMPEDAKRALRTRFL